MVQGTTPTFILTLPSTVDLSIADHVTFSLTQGRVSIKKKEEELTIDHNTVNVYLTQAETLRFAANIDAELQLNWTYDNGSRACSEIKSVNVGRNLLKEVME